MNTKTDAACAGKKGIVTLKNGKKTFQKYEKTLIDRVIKDRKPADTFNMNLIQRALYRRVMYGLAEYTPDQLQAMPYREQQKIERDYKFAKAVLHALKIKTYFKLENRLFDVIVPEYNLSRNVYDFIDVSIPKKLTLHKLGISTKDVCAELIRNRLLPKNFFNLNVDSIEL